MVNIFSIITYLFLILFFFSSIVSLFFVVKNQNAIILERLGKFNSIKYAGLHIKLPIIDNIVGRLSLKIQQLDVVIETKTHDNVFIRLKVSVQFQVIKNKVYDAFYKLDNPNLQITSYIFDVVRAEVPKMKLDDVFERKDDIALALKRELSDSMNDYGYDIIKTLITDIEPDEHVKNAMNKINTSEREKVAAEHEAQAEKIKIVTKAKAEAESKKLQGQGIADQRREIARGLLDSIETLHKVGLNSNESSTLIVMTHHYDSIQSVGEKSKSNLILLPNFPGASSEMFNNTLSAFTASKYINNNIVRKNNKKNKDNTKLKY